MSSLPDSTAKPTTDVVGDAGSTLPITGSRRRSRPRSRGRTWFFRLVALSLPFFGLLALELCLRLAGVGRDLTLLQPVGDGTLPGTFRMNPAIDQVYYGPVDLLGPEERLFRVPKPADTYRIVVIGGSTVAGFPYHQDLAFPRFLEYVLRQQRLGRSFEVLNAAIIAINTFGDSDMVEQVLTCSPDLIVVYTGHNEFVGPGGAGSKNSGVPPRWNPALYALRRTRLHQCAFHLMLPKEFPTRELMSQLLGDMTIPYGGPKFHLAESNVRGNMERMIQIVSEAKVPLLLSTPLSNIRDYCPIQSLLRDDLRPRERAAWQEAFDRGEQELAADRHEAALEAFDQADTIDSGHALLAFRRGQTLEKLERWDEARMAYEDACDLDSCRFRAPSTFPKIIRDLTAEATAPEVHFLDTAAEFVRGVPHGIPGKESLLDHVHFTYAGNWQLAEIFAEHITREILKDTWREDRIPDAAERDELSGIMTQDHLSAYSLALEMLKKSPYSLSADTPKQLDLIRAKLAEGFESIPEREREIFADISTEKLQFEMISSLNERYAAAGLEDERGPLLRRGVARRPWNGELPPELAEWELRHGNPAAALKVLDEAAKWRAGSPRAAKLRVEAAGASPDRDGK